MRRRIGSQWVAGKLAFLRISRNTFHRRFYYTLSLSVAYSASFRCIESAGSLLFVSHWKSRLSKVAPTAKNIGFLMLSVSVGYRHTYRGTFWACLMLREICPHALRKTVLFKSLMCLQCIMNFARFGSNKKSTLNSCSRQLRP